jgi:hypothetical protein
MPFTVAAIPDMVTGKGRAPSSCVVPASCDPNKLINSPGAKSCL